jgi:membrane-associated phospholipid phosphatase
LAFSSHRNNELPGQQLNRKTPNAIAPRHHEYFINFCSKCALAGCPPYIWPQKIVMAECRILDARGLVKYLFVLALLALAFTSPCWLVQSYAFNIWLNQFHSPFTDAAMWGITYLGDGIVYLIIVLALLLLRRHKWVVAIAMLAVIQTAICQILKNLVFGGMPRPSKVIPEDIWATLHTVKGVTIHGFNTFPSGHTMTAFALAWFLILHIKLSPVARVGLLLLAALVGISRIYLLQHFYIDVVFGAVLGIYSAKLTQWVFYKFSLRQGWQLVHAV